VPPKAGCAQCTISAKGHRPPWGLSLYSGTGETALVPGGYLAPWLLAARLPVCAFALCVVSSDELYEDLVKVAKLTGAFCAELCSVLSPRPHEVTEQSMCARRAPDQEEGGQWVG
jgi:hypothetical protein